MAAALPVRDIYQHTEVTIHNGADSLELDLLALNRETFRDQKWENALAHLRSGGLADEQHVKELLLEGARAFGMWRVSEPALAALVAQVLEGTRGGPSAGLESWLALSREAALAPQEQRALMDLRPARMLTVKGDPQSSKEEVAPRGPCARFGHALGEKAGFGDALTSVKWVLAIVLVAVCLVYASWVVWVKYDGILDLFPWPIFFARAGGLATAIITGLLYLTMARTSMKQAYKLLSVNSKVLMIFDGHKDMHLFLAKCLGVAAFIHVLSHLLSTVPALEYGSAKQLNDILACADREQKLKGWPSLAWLQWPACPLTQDRLGWGAILFGSTPGLSGVVLVALLVLLGWTGRAKARSQKFDRFWYAHNFVILAWPLTMFVHGSNQWIGVGFPLVVFTAAVPICLYLIDRVARLLRYYLYSGKAVKIASAVIRPGRGGGPAGALTHLEIQKPPGLWTFVPGMYAFINMPEYAPLQWHPFTICSGRDDEHVEFIVSGVGDWTQELAARCLSAQTGHCALPQVALDGPYAAPAQSALARPILVAVGAGVGITPFLSLMSSLISLIEGSSEGEVEALSLKEAHFFWMTRSVDEFLFGRRHFTRIASSPQLRKRIHLHLHTTAREPEGNAAAYLFRQAVKRQSKIDQAAFAEGCDGRHVLISPQLPWCWMNKSHLDIMWLSDLTTAGASAEEAAGAACVAEEENPPEVQALEAAEEGRAGVPATPAPSALPGSSTVARALHEPQPALARSASPSVPEQPALSRGTSRCGSSRAMTHPDSADWARELLRTTSRRLTTQTVSAARRTTRALHVDLEEGDASPLRATTTGSRNPGSPSASRSPSRVASPSASRSPARPGTRTWRARAPSGSSGVDLVRDLHAAREESSEASSEEEILVPVAFGRPDFEKELRSIGKHWHGTDRVHIYVCGNDAIVQGLRSTADALNAEAIANAQVASSTIQKYVVAYERFG